MNTTTALRTLLVLVLLTAIAGIFLLTAGLPIHAAAQGTAGPRDLDEGFGTWSAKTYDESTNPAPGSVFGQGVWPGREDRNWTVRETRDVQGGYTLRTLDICPSESGTAGEVRTKYSYETADAFVGAIPLGDNDADLLTVWMGGSAYHVVVIGRIVIGRMDGNPRVLLSVGTREFPQMAYVDADGRIDILVRPDEGLPGDLDKTGVLKVLERTDAGYEDGGYIRWSKAVAPDLGK